ncbi:hypothetical protein F862_gp011 [Vibrio phage vB_VpaS_MAR10]|uniref:Uncharacterized protein n=1 Tax=Vibrio phage vB_VpaS_MAR10 TaxID=1229755 RepID=K7RVG0_9CAUD|nr:hypothetical protein F862_gp011 [Vibrio phage vB_VpaS_MAR10]AFV81235.1 hypothetical protein MAR10_003 [Vibrio phage vB_VpaS_MAR10]
MEMHCKVAQDILDERKVPRNSRIVAATPTAQSLAVCYNGTEESKEAVLSLVNMCADRFGEAISVGTIPPTNALLITKGGCETKLSYFHWLVLSPSYELKVCNHARFEEQYDLPSDDCQF